MTTNSFKINKSPLGCIVASIICTILLIGTPHPASAQTSMVRDSAILAFKPGSSVLYEYYKNNASELSSILKFVEAHSAKLQNGLSHINIVSYITEKEVGNTASINNASIQASVVRAQFKSKFNIPHSAITFSIDTTTNTNNCVRVDYINAPIPLYSNSNIFYTESASMAAMQQQIAKYRPSIPYTNYYMKLSQENPNFNLGELATLPAKPLQEVAQYDANTEAIIILPTIEKEAQRLTPPDLTPQLAEPKTAGNATSNDINPPTEPAQQYIPKTYTPEVFGLKTNVLYWAMATPNIEMEFYIGQRVSLNIEGAYTWGWFLPEDKAYHLWNAGGEVRVWLKGQKKFIGHFFGVYASAGQYDFKFGQHGNQGDFYSAGITYGYTLPIRKKFNIEFSLGLGFISYSNNKYEYVNGQNFSVEKTDNNMFYGPTKAKVALLWKF